MECTLNNLIGNIPVSEHLGAALKCIATKHHMHDCYVTSDEVEDLKMKVEMLINFVGNTSIAEQINMAIENIKSSFFKEVM